MTERLTVRSRTTETALVDSGGPRAIIAAPDTPDLAGLGDELAAALHEVTGVRFPVLPGCLIDRGMWEANHVLVVGDMSVNRFASELYRRIRTFEDCYYPGPGGWVVRSVHDTFGSGTNCLIAAGSDVDGHQRAMRALVDKIASAWPEPVGFLLDPHPCARALDSIFELSTLVPYPQYGYRYLLTGEAEAFEYFRQGCLMGEDQEIHWKFFSHLRQLMLMPVWDLVEESPLMADSDRERIVNHFLRCYRSHEGIQWYGFLNELGSVIGNHGSAAALNLHFAAHYFSLRFQLEETSDWFAKSRQHLTSFWRIPRSGADMAYMEFTGSTADLMTYALQTGADDMFVSETLTKFAERAMLLCGNIGYAICEGEVGFDQKLNSRCALPHHFFGRAAAITGDGRYQWWARRPNPSGNAQGVQQRSAFFQTWDAGIEAKPPLDQIGIRWALVNPTLFAAHATKWEAAGALRDAGRAVDKLAVRSGLTPDDAYLAMGGLGTAGRGDSDGGAILWYEACGRVFLVDGGGLCTAEQFHHNSIVVIKDGQGSEAVRYMTLEQASTLGARGFASLAAPDYNHCRWERTLYWRGDDRFLVLDRLTAYESGKFDVSSHWNILGDSERLADGVATAQAPRHMIERREAALRIHCRPGSWCSQQTLAAGDYVFLLRAKPDYLQGHVGIRLRIDGRSLPDIHVTPGSRYGFGADSEPGLPMDAEVAFSVDQGGTHSLELGISVALGVDILATAVRTAAGDVIDIPLADWQPGVEVLQGIGTAYFRLATDQAEMQALATADYMASDWRLYPLADPSIQAWVDRRGAYLKAGDDLTFAHLFGASKDAVPELSIRRAGAGIWSFRDGDTTGVLLDHAELAPPFFEGARLLAEWDRDRSATHFFGVSARRLGEFPSLLGLSESGAFSWQPERGILALDLPTGARVWLGIDDDGTWQIDGTEIKPSRLEAGGLVGMTIELTKGQYTIEHPPLSVADARVQKLMTDLDAAAATAAPVATGAPIVAAPTQGTETARQIADLGAPITALAPGDTPEIAFVAGTEDGRVFIAGDDLQPVERYRTGGAIGALAIADFGDGPVILAGSDDAHLYAFQTDGTPLFSRGFEWTEQSGARYSRHSEVLAILVADLDGDQAPEIYVGVNNQSIYKMMPDGSTAWGAHNGTAPANILLPWHGKTPGLLVGSSHPVSPSGMVQLMDVNAEDMAVSRYYIGSVWGARLRKAIVADIDNDGENEVVLAVASGLVRVFYADRDQADYPGDEPWMEAKWEVWTGLPPVDILPAGSDGLWIATAAGFLNRHDGSGTMIACVSSPELPVALVPRSDSDAVDLVTATGIRRLSETGELVPVISVPEPVVRAENIRDGAATLLIAGSGALFVS